MSVVVETRALTKEFPGGRGVRDINLSVRKGQVFGFLGPNGAGKSTFVKMLVGLLFPTSGEARVLGLPAGDLGVRRRVGYLPELFRYQDWLTAEEVLRFHVRLCKMEGTFARQRIVQVLKEVGLSGREGERVRGYSKGMQQRLGLACALLPEPEVVFLDEPASALDPGGRHEVRELLANLRDQGITVFLNTHLLEDVESICTEVALLIDGEIRAHGNVSDILNPEPIWEFIVGGYEPWMGTELTSVVSPRRVSIRVSEMDREGINRVSGMDREGTNRVSGMDREGTNRASAMDREGTNLLLANLSNQEQVAWLNHELVSLGVSVYSIQPRKTKLESWFLMLTEAEKSSHGQSSRKGGDG